MAERDFNSAQASDVIISFENKFQLLEDRSSCVIRKILETRNLLSLGPLEFADLNLFVVAQILRSKMWRENAESITREIKRRAPGLKMSPDTSLITDDQFNKLLQLKNAFESLDKLAYLLCQKLCFLMIGNGTDPIYISDSPVVMHNLNDYGPYGNIGLALAGIEIYFPLSAEVILAYNCPTIAEQMKRNIETAEKNASKAFGAAFLSKNGLDVRSKFEIAEAKAQICRAQTAFKLLTKHRCVPMSADNHLYVNSLQISSSHRYIASKFNDFDLVRKGLKERPNWREGRKMVFN